MMMAMHVAVYGYGWAEDISFSDGQRVMNVITPPDNVVTESYGIRKA